MPIKKLLTRAFLCMSPWALGACEKELISDDPINAESSVSIITRNVNAEETISFPVDVYVFGKETKTFVNHKKLIDEDTPLAFSLPLGSYSVYAIGGTDESCYILPTEETIEENSEITLREGKEHTDLMTAHQDIILETKEDYQLTLQLDRQVIQLTNVTISQVPADVSSISISLSTSYKSILINGKLGTEWTHNYSLADHGNGEWVLPTPVMMLLDTESVIITISMTQKDNSVKDYIYSCPDDLMKNYQISINATYQEDHNVNIIGSITGSSWAGNREIVFNFGESNISNDNNNGNNNNDDDDDIINATAPATNTVYKDCYVVNVTPNEKGYKEVLLAYKEDISIDPQNKTEEQVLQDVNSQLNSLSINNISGWRLPNKEEASLISSKSGLLHILTKFYYYLEDGRIKIFNSNGLLNIQYNAGEEIRPVTILKFKQ